MELHTREIKISEKVSIYVEYSTNINDIPCILISGAGANSSFWPKSLKEGLYNRGFRVVSYDHRDFGYSSKVNWQKDAYVFQDLVEDLYKILTQLNVQKCHLIGHSMGGFIAQIMAIQFPAMVLSITSISSSTSSSELPPISSDTWDFLLSNTPTNNFDYDLNGFLEVWKFLNGSVTFDVNLAIEYTKNLYKRQSIEGAIGEGHHKSQNTLTDRSEELKKLKIPALIIHGEEDRLVHKTGGVQTAEAIPNAKLVVLSNMGHMIFNETLIRQIKDEILQFLQELKIEKSPKD